MLTIEHTIERAGGAVTGGEDVVVVTITGSADIHNEEHLDKALAKIAAQEPRFVVVDLAGVDILTSLAIGALVAFRTRVMANGGRVTLARVPELIAKTMRFTRVSELFPRYATVADARAGVAAMA